MSADAKWEWMAWPCCCEGEGKPCEICQGGFLPVGGWKVEVAGFAIRDCLDCDSLNGTFYCDQVDAKCTASSDPFSGGSCCCLYYEFPVAVCTITRLEVWLLTGGVGMPVNMLVIYRRSAVSTCPPVNPAADPTQRFRFGKANIGLHPMDCDGVSELEMAALVGGDGVSENDCVPPYDPWGVPGGYVKVSAET